VEDERLNNMEQVVIKPQSLPEQLRFFADTSATQGRLSISDLITKAYVTDTVPGNTLKAIRAKETLREIPIVECT